MSQKMVQDVKIYARITDTIFAVIMGLSFKEYHWLLAPPVASFKLAVLVFGYLVVVFSRVGYHKSLSAKPYKSSKRFFVDLWILYMYVILTFAPGAKDLPTDINLVLTAQVGIFIGYLIWDFIKEIEYPKTAKIRIRITGVCFILTLAILFLFHRPIWLNGCLIFGTSLRDWMFLFGEYFVMLIFWGLKWSVK